MVLPGREADGLIMAASVQYDCPLAKHAACELYEAPMEPVLVNGTVRDGENLRS